MPIFLIAASTTVVSMFISIAIMIGLRLAGDITESSLWFYRTVKANLVGSIFAIVSNFCIYFYGYSSIVEGTTFVHIITIVSWYLTDIFCVQIAHSLMVYIGILSGRKRETDKVARISSKIVFVLLFFVVLSSLLSAMGSIILKNQTLVTVSRTIVGITLIIVEIILLITVFYSKKQLSKMRLALLLFYVFSNVAALIFFSFKNANFYFIISAIYLLLLFVTIQMESINLSNIETVRQALNTTENLNKELEQNMKTLEFERNRLNEIAAIFRTAYDINLEENYYTVIGQSPEKVSRAIDNTDGEKPDVQTIMWNVMRKVVADSYLDAALRFTNFSTLEDRMRGKKSIVFETISDEDEWMRYIFVRPNDDLNGPLPRVWYVTQSIDREMREIEYLNKVTYNDDLTGVKNRNAYIKEIDELDKNELPKDLWFIVADVNGLKNVNDTLGHEAGDELIIGTAKCLKSAIGTAGEVYRIGGDEFICILRCDEQTIDYLVDIIGRNRCDFRGKLNSKLSFSVGYVGASHFEHSKCADLYREADRRMYETKEEYYKSL